MFDGAEEIEIKEMLKLADLPTSGQITLSMVVQVNNSERPVTVGYVAARMLKLNHLVDDKDARPFYRFVQLELPATSWW